MEDWNSRKTAKSCTEEDMSPVGGRRARRWRNEKELRDLAGPMSAEHMASLFSPVPFGISYDSMWTVAMHPENYSVWENFISIGMDEESLALKSFARKETAPRDHYSGARRNWQRMGSRGRRIVCRAATCEPGLVKRLEDAILQFDFSLEGRHSMLFDSRFERLLCNGLCDYHGLSYETTFLEGEDAEMTLWHPRRRVVGMDGRITCTEFLVHIGKIGHVPHG